MMNLSNLAHILPALTTLSAPATEQRYGGRNLRLYRDSVRVAATAETVEAIRTLLAAGHRVRVYEGNVIWSPELADDGALVWVDRKSRKDRDAAGYSVVEVAL